MTRDAEIHVSLASATPDRLEATVIAPEGVPPLAFDRVDSIDPPLGHGPGPSASASPGG